MLIEENGEMIVKHDFKLTSDGYFICNDCGFKIKSPNLQDKEILNEDDYLSVKILQQEFLESCIKNKKDITFQDICDKYKTSLYTLEIERIRLSNDYKYKYDYRDQTGYYYSDFMYINNVNDLENNNDGLFNTEYYLHSFVETINEENMIKYKYTYEWVPVIIYATGFMLGFSSDKFIAFLGSTCLENVALGISNPEYSTFNLFFSMLQSYLTNKLPNCIVKDGMQTYLAARDVSELSKYKPAYGDKVVRINYGYKSYNKESGRFCDGCVTVCTYIFRDGELVNYEPFL